VGSRADLDDVEKILLGLEVRPSAAQPVAGRYIYYPIPAEPQSMPSPWARNEASYRYKTRDKIKVPSTLICTILGMKRDDKYFPALIFYECNFDLISRSYARFEPCYIFSGFISYL
jgi:hypothetical protein